MGTSNFYKSLIVCHFLYIGRQFCLLSQLPSDEHVYRVFQDNDTPCGGDSTPRVLLPESPSRNQGCHLHRHVRRRWTSLSEQRTSWCGGLRLTPPNESTGLRRSYSDSLWTQHFPNPRNSSLDITRVSQSSQQSAKGWLPATIAMGG